MVPEVRIVERRPGLSLAGIVLGVYLLGAPSPACLCLPLSITPSRNDPERRSTRPTSIKCAPPSRPNAAVATHGGRPFHLGGLRSLRGGCECSRAGFDSSTVVPYQAASQLGYRDVLRPATLTVQAATRKPPPACFHVEQRLSVETVCSLVDHLNFVSPRHVKTLSALVSHSYSRADFRRIR